MTMVSEKEIIKMAEEYAEENNSAYTNDYYGFIQGFKKSQEILKESFVFIDKFTERLEQREKEVELLIEEYKLKLENPKCRNFLSNSNLTSATLCQFCGQEQSVHE